MKHPRSSGRLLIILVSVMLTGLTASPSRAEVISDYTDLVLTGCEVREIETLRLADDKYGVAGIFHIPVYDVDILYYWVIEGRQGDGFGEVVWEQLISWAPGSWGGLVGLDADSAPREAGGHGYIVWVGARAWLGYAKLSASNVVWMQHVSASEIEMPSDRVVSRFLQPTIAIDAADARGVIVFVPEWAETGTCINTVGFQGWNGLASFQDYEWLWEGVGNLSHPELAYNTHFGGYVLSVRKETSTGNSWALESGRVRSGGILDWSPLTLDQGTPGDARDPGRILIADNRKDENTIDPVISIATDKAVYWIDAETLVPVVGESNPYLQAEITALCTDWTDSDQLAQTFRRRVWVSGPNIRIGSQQERWGKDPGAPERGTFTTDVRRPRSCACSYTKIDPEVFLAGETTDPSTIRTVMLSME